MARAESPSPHLSDYPNRANSPQPQLVSKRDKRRNMLTEKFSEVVASFAENRDSHYRAQVAAVQADMNLIIKADLSSNKPLEDTGAEAAELTASLAGGIVPGGPSPQGDFVAQVGRYYSGFVDGVNDAMEDRDVALTMLFAKLRSTTDELNRMHKYRVQLAHEEHRALSNTLRERLIQSFSAKKAKLLKEKEQLDISDSNALLLNPNQFSITNPASPGGAQSNRKTRHTRHRVGDPDELVNSAQENKRKRKAAFEEENGSPGPASRNIEMGFGSPFRDAKAKTSYNQFEAATYSIERLFTEKELLLSKNTAEHAAVNFFRRLKTSENDAVTNGVNGEAGDESGGIATGQDTEQDDATPAAPDMMRTSSYHATRGAARNANGDLDSVAERIFRGPSQGPVILPAAHTSLLNKHNASAPTPPMLPPEDVADDLSIITKTIRADDPTIDKLLEAATSPARTREFQYHVPGTDIAGAGASGHRLVPPSIEVGGVPMSAQSSAAGFDVTAGGRASRHS